MCVLTTSLPSVACGQESTEAGLHKSHSSPQFAAATDVAVAAPPLPPPPPPPVLPTPQQLLVHLLLHKSRAPRPVKATLSRHQLETAAEDLLQHLAYLSQTGQIPAQVGRISGPNLANPRSLLGRFH